MKIDFSKYVGNALYVRLYGELYRYELLDGTYSELTPFEELPEEIQERVAILMTAPKDAVIKGVGWRDGDNEFFLKDY